MNNKTNRGDVLTPEDLPPLEKKKEKSRVKKSTEYTMVRYLSRINCEKNNNNFMTISISVYDDNTLQIFDL